MMKCVTCNYWTATDGDQCEACASTTFIRDLPKPPTGAPLVEVHDDGSTSHR